MPRMMLLTRALAVVFAGVTLAAGASGSVESAQPRWVNMDLGTLQGWKDSQAVGINPRGWIIGTCFRSESSTDAPRAFMWQGEKPVDLGTLGGTLASASAINGTGWIVGWSTTKRGVRHAFLWRNGRMSDLGTLPGYPNSSASAVNDRGQVVGLAYVKTASGRPVQRAAFLWQKGRMRSLGVLRGGRASEAVALNELGQIVGRSESGTRNKESGALAWHAVLWQNGTTTDLGALPAFPESRALDVNERGQVVGEVIYDSGGHVYDTAPFLWQRGKMTRLPAPPSTGDAEDAFASAIGDRGDVVGGWLDTENGNEHALLWRSGRVTQLEPIQGSSWATDVNSSGLVVGASAHAVVWDNLRLTDLGTLGGPASHAVAVNDSGQIAGTSDTADGREHAVLWTLRRGT